MKKLLLGVAAMLALTAQSPAPAGKAAVKLWRLDCGQVQVNDLNAFSDTRAYTGQTKLLGDSCYLIKHGDQYMIWDTGLPAAVKGAKVSSTDPMSPTMSATLPEQLAVIGIKPEQIAVVGISHYHFDHVGQASDFPKARLLIGAGDWAALSAKPPQPGIDASTVAPWISGGSTVDPVSGDRDVFGDGSVTMLDTPGHTPGHHSLLVKLAGMGNVLLTGDLAHFHENYDANGVPTFNTNRADTLASLDRFKALAANLKATVIIQHDARDIAKLPAFPKAAE